MISGLALGRHWSRQDFFFPPWFCPLSLPCTVSLPFSLQTITPQLLSDLGTLSFWCLTLIIFPSPPWKETFLTLPWGSSVVPTQTYLLSPQVPFFFFANMYRFDQVLQWLPVSFSWKYLTPKSKQPEPKVMYHILPCTRVMPSPRRSAFCCQRLHHIHPRICFTISYSIGGIVGTHLQICGINMDLN